MKNQSDKKTCPNYTNTCKSNSCFGSWVNSFWSFFQVARHNQTPKAHQYLLGLIKLEKGKANMERMEEEIPDSEYRAYQHFITNSDWDYQGVIGKLGRDASSLMEANQQATGKPTGLIIDESAHLKKGDKSVAVSKQYAGVVGKVENCQVGVYASLVNDRRAALINERLFLPKKWADAKRRCEKAGVPKDQIRYKTKPQLALALIEQALDEGIAFDWVGGDGLYGHNSELRAGIDTLGLLYVLDVHKDEKVYLEMPTMEVPQKTNKRGRPAIKPRLTGTPIRLDTYCGQLEDEDWQIVDKVRMTHKGWKKSRVHTRKIWVAESEQVKELTLVITQTHDDKRLTKYSFSNGELAQYSPSEYAYFQAQRYWVERTFDDAKNELGMSDYQVRKWKGWHHHHALVMMACLYLLKQKIESENQAPLMSVRDARILMIVMLFGTDEEVEMRLKQMEARHHKRQKDIDLHYKT